MIEREGFASYVDDPDAIVAKFNEIKKISDNGKKSNASSTSTDSSKAAVTLSSGVKLTDADVTYIIDKLEAVLKSN